MRPMHDAEKKSEQNRRPIMQYGFRDRRIDIFYVHYCDTIKFAKVVTGFNIVTKMCMFVVVVVDIKFLLLVNHSEY